MEDPEITFLFQFGNLRDTVTVAIPTLNLKSLKDRACDFINTKVSEIVSILPLCSECPQDFIGQTQQRTTYS